MKNQLQCRVILFALFILFSSDLFSQDTAAYVPGSDSLYRFLNLNDRGEFVVYPIIVDSNGNFSTAANYAPLSNQTIGFTNGGLYINDGTVSFDNTTLLLPNITLDGGVSSLLYISDNGEITPMKDGDTTHLQYTNTGWLSIADKLTIESFAQSDTDSVTNFTFVVADENGELQSLSSTQFRRAVDLDRIEPYTTDKVWKTDGNFGYSTAGSGIWLGTKDTYPLKVKTNNIERMSINGVDGEVTINSRTVMKGNHKVDGSSWIGAKFTAGPNCEVYLNGPETRIANKVGIGLEHWQTIGGDYLLAVNGLLGAREIKVHTKAWADHVFQSNYDLMSLHDLESFIQKNKHLPGVPSNEEIEENDGFEVGEMNRILLEKVEELTLHVIELQKQIDELKQ